MNSDLNQLDYAASIQKALTTRWLGRPFHFYPSVASTNDILAEMARDGAPAGTMVVANYQSAGKGRLGRSWLAPAGTSLLFSLLFRPSWPPEQLAWLTMLAGLAVVGAVETLSGLTAQLKWPNDMMLRSRDQWRKFGGILLEAQFADERLDASIIGIGINVNIEPQQLPDARIPATSLLAEAGQVLNRAMLLKQLLSKLEDGYAAAEQGNSPRVLWQKKLLTLGQRVQVIQGDRLQPLIGVAERTDEWGRLIIVDGNGRRHTIAAGDVTLQVDNSGE